MKENRGSQVCARCIMDTTDPDIRFDDDGVCNHCRKYDLSASRVLFSGEEGERRLQVIGAHIKEAGRKREYDCVLGLSGGTDSSFAAYHVKRLGLRPLIVHLDNGWNTQISNENIENIARSLNMPLHTFVIDWEEFKDLQISFLKASVVDIEVLTDHAIAAVLYRSAIEQGVKYIISGSNIVTERTMPVAWVFNKNDLSNIKDIHRRFGKLKLKSFPTLGLWKRLYYQYVRKVTFIKPLNYVPYIKKDAQKIIARELGWKDYGGKHYESLFTRFYQAYILPTKFSIDKRKAHLSTLICSGQITREEALEEMKKPLFEDRELAEIKEYVLKKLGLSDLEFKEIMDLPVKSHYDYKTDARFQRFFSSLKRKIKQRR